MMRTFVSKFTILLTTILTFTAVVTAVFELDARPVPMKEIDAFRYFVIVQSGVFLGLLALCTLTISRIKLDPSDKLLRPLGAWGLSSAVLAVFGLLSVIATLHQPFISWRSPLLFLGLLIGNIAGFLILVRIKKMLRQATKRGVTIKLTVIDTSGPGLLDHDLDSGHAVAH